MSFGDELIEIVRRAALNGFIAEQRKETNMIDMYDWPKTVVIGLSRAGDELEMRYPWHGAAELADWRFVQTAYKLHLDGRREPLPESDIKAFNHALFADLIAEAPAETQNARFDRLKAEAHARRAREAVPSISLDMALKAVEHATKQDEREQALVNAFARSLPSDIPLFAGPRHGLER